LSAGSFFSGDFIINPQRQLQISVKQCAGFIETGAAVGDECRVQ
jgi:hypothetical protein